MLLFKGITADLRRRRKEEEKKKKKKKKSKSKFAEGTLMEDLTLDDPFSCFILLLSYVCLFLHIASFQKLICISLVF